ncbi:glycoside hydrolase family 25 protein [Nocardia implantans]|uniref:Glycoside hydrolase family 25 protein n=1 Tax=Nocardia implantans TaxID=3108168 RepID=A0ABU6AMG7_9NOCA|nr:MULTISPECIES: glycoside hydrolase family 25 protein [unclassified Nocardia]MBF6193572.1 glycoside hydrolase family 25 protein [Nocardia beijingensis]MEA3532180.1 glycoside hydrolase family 25 protein [Nocardia sp. CDC192]MEB3508671.1 glycoside hydrolase family 25 protein [Nocardia sp. CDC186]
MGIWRSTTRRGAALSLLTLSGVLVATLPATATPTGPDVSSWQHTDGTLIDWFAVKRSGHDFAMVKATEGLNYINPYFVPDSLLMRAAGMARGTYHYARPNLPPEPQAALYAAVVLGQNGPLDLPPVLDLEVTGGLAPAALIDWTRRYLNTVETLTGRVPIVYTYPVFWRTAMADTHEFAQYPLWIADYRGNSQPEVPGGWSTWTFWQTTDSGAIPGIEGRVDLNVYSGAQGGFAGYANMGGTGSG